MKKHFSLLLSAFFLIANSLKSQETSYINSLTFNFQKNTAYFPAHYHLTGNVWGGEIAYNISARNKDWAKRLSIRSVDIIFDYKNFQNVAIKDQDDKFGNSYALHSGLSFLLYKNHFLEVGLNPSLGLGYTNETFYTNGNEILGSKINLYSRAIFTIETPVSEKTSIGLNIGVLHYSNGGTRVPNDGINMGTAGLSIRRKMATEEKPSIREIKDFKRNNFEFAANVGKRGVYQSKKGLYKTGLYGGYSYRLSSFIALGLGTDAVYYHTVYDSSRNEETFQSNATSLDKWRIGVAAGPDLWMDNFAIMLKYGYYLHFNSLKSVDTYWTAGVKYNLLDWLGIHAKGYIHKTEVDYIGAGLNFMF